MKRAFMIHKPIPGYFPLLLILPFVAACSALPGNSAIPSERENAELYALGEGVYMNHCAECHGANGEGQRPDAPLQPDETGRYPAPPHNETGHTWHHDDDLIISIIRDGNSAPGFYPMPAFGETLTDEEIEAVLLYIKGMWTEEQRVLQAEYTQSVREQNQNAE